MSKQSEKQKGQLKKQLETERKEHNYGLKLAKIRCINDYIKNKVNGTYYLTRCNMIANQLQSGNKIVEKIDGALKTEEYVRSEYALIKIQAITSNRNAFFNRQDLLTEHKMTEKEIIAVENDWFNGKILRDNYDENYKKIGKAKFVNTP